VATIFRTTMAPTKLELLTTWLPEQPWWVGGGRYPQLTPAGGFRLDDPLGEVGLEFIFVTDVSGGQPVTYHVPLSYRAGPLPGAEHALLGTSEHGVLGRRWIHDGPHDPVLTAALDAFVHGRVQAQHQSTSDTLEPSVTVSGAPRPGAVVEVVRVLGGEATAPCHVEAGWSLPGGTSVRGPVALVR
jgi:Maltokinase N-terminal cap domain